MYIKYYRIPNKFVFVESTWSWSLYWCSCIWRQDQATKKSGGAQASDCSGACEMPQLPQTSSATTTACWIPLFQEIKMRTMNKATNKQRHWTLKKGIGYDCWEAHTWSVYILEIIGDGFVKVNVCRCVALHVDLYGFVELFHLLFDVGRLLRTNARRLANMVKPKLPEMVMVMVMEQTQQQGNNIWTHVLENK